VGGWIAAAGPAAVLFVPMLAAVAIAALTLAATRPAAASR